MLKRIVPLLFLITCPSALAQGGFQTADPDNLTFKFRSNEPGARFECRVNRGIWRPCASPARLKLNPGKYRFEVRAVDNAGNRDQSPAYREFEVVERNQEKLVLPEPPKSEVAEPTPPNDLKPELPTPPNELKPQEPESSEQAEGSEKPVPKEPQPDPESQPEPPTDTELPLPADKLPVNVEPPAVEIKETEEGLVLNCNPGLWRNNPENFSYTWKSDERSLRNTQELRPENLDTSKLRCEVEASNQLGAAAPIESAEACLAETLELDSPLSCEQIAEPPVQDSLPSSDQMPPPGEPHPTLEP